VNRAERRRRRFAHRIDQARAAADAANKPLTLYGLTGACVDCTATGALTRHPDGTVTGHIWHDASCPAAAGVTEWQPVP
jgi:hypothetical protein